MQTEKDLNITETQLKALNKRYEETKEDLKMIFETDFRKTIVTGTKMGVPPSKEVIDKYKIV